MLTVTSSFDTALDAAHLKRVLDAIHTSQPLPETPLKKLTAVQRLLTQIEPMGEAIAGEVALLDWLSTVIDQELQFHRQHYALPALNVLSPRPQALMALRRDFQQQNVELEAWSLLYYRYVRVDLALGWEEMAALVGQTPRNLRRRRGHGIQRLLHCLVQQELRTQATPDELGEPTAVNPSGR